MSFRLRVRRPSRHHLAGGIVTCEGGAELLEAALVFPVLLTLLLGIVWLGRAYNVYQTVIRAAREGARVGVAPSCGACGNAYPSSSDIRTAVTNALSAASLDPSKATITISLPSKPTGQVSVQISYPFTLYVPFTTLNRTTKTIKTTVTMRSE